MTTLDWIGALMLACGFSLLVSLIVYRKTNGKYLAVMQLYEHYHDGF